MSKRVSKFMILLFVMLGWVGSTHAQSPVTPIPPQAGAQTASAFVGSAATPRPINTPPIPQNPFMAQNGRSNTHNDTYMSDTYAGRGPLGKSPVVLSSVLGGDCVTLAFDQQGRIVTVCLTLKTAQLFLVDARTLAPLAHLDLPAKEQKDTNQIAAGSYFYLDQRDHILIPTADRTIRDVSVNSGGDGISLQRGKSYDLTKQVDVDDTIASALPDFAGNLWFITKNGVVGLIHSAGSIESYRIATETIGNSFALDETGGVFIASDHALYRFDLDTSGKPIVTWRETYERGSGQKPGQFSYGTGTTPTLMGKDFVTITDNAEPQMHALVYRRAAKATDKRLVCSVAVFAAGQSATENSLIATDNSIIVENNYGYSSPAATLLGRTTQPGVTRIDINPDGTCRTVWTSAEHVPNVVSKLSLAAGLVYTYTKDQGLPDAWYFTALDFETGKTVYKVLAGTGLNFNSHYAGLYLGADGTAYVGVIGGLVAVRDSD
jgi:hypothetical protein